MNDWAQSGEPKQTYLGIRTWNLIADSIDTRNSHLPKNRWKVKINKDPFEKTSPPQIKGEE